MLTEQEEAADEVESSRTANDIRKKYRMSTYYDDQKMNRSTVDVQIRKNGSRGGTHLDENKVRYLVRIIRESVESVEPVEPVEPVKPVEPLLRMEPDERTGIVM